MNSHQVENSCTPVSLQLQFVCRNSLEVYSSKSTKSRLFAQQQLCHFLSGSCIFFKFIKKNASGARKTDLIQKVHVVAHPPLDHTAASVNTDSTQCFFVHEAAVQTPGQFCTGVNQGLDLTHSDTVIQWGNYIIRLCKTTSIFKLRRVTAEALSTASQTELQPFCMETTADRTEPTYIPSYGHVLDLV